MEGWIIWIIGVVLKCNHKCPYKNEVKDLTQSHVKEAKGSRVR